MPPKKSKTAPNQHDKRHENGLAPPGKRVTRQRSNGQLNGHPTGKPVSTVPPPQLPSTGLNQGLKFPRPADNTAENAAGPVARDQATAAEVTGRDRTSSEVSLEDFGTHGDLVDSMQNHTIPAPMDGHATAAAAAYKPSQGQPGGTIAAVSTILTYYPLRDAISILILLLSLPPTLVLVIQTLFASLTFVPPTAGLSLSTLPNLKDIFNTTTIAAPALWTVLMVDIVIGLIWMVVWKPVQNIFLDLSQAAIAVSLSGAAASASGPTYSIATSTVIVCVVHVLRYRAIHLTALDYLRSVLHKLDVGIRLDASSYVSSFHSAPLPDRGWIFTLIRTVLGIHIVSQGVTTCVRYSLVKNKNDQTLSAIPKTDPEAVAGSDTAARSQTNHLDGSPQPSTASGSDGRHTGALPNHREGKSRESSTKKKRKQANQARSQQPLWAAIASTKVTFIKEVEQRETASDAREVAAIENNTTTTLSTISQTTHRIWICEIRDTEIIFCAEVPLGATIECVDAQEDCSHLATGIDKSKPFYVRVNGATWASTRIVPIGPGDEGTRTSDRYVGEIFGLAPRSSYHCELISITSHSVLCDASLITQPAPTAEQAASASTQPHPQTLRPSSPMTTLRQSIYSAEVKLNEVRNRSKKSKKDQRAAHSDIKKEINALRSKLESSGGVDDRQERRLLQLSQHKNQAEDAVAEMKIQIEALGEVPADELADSEAKKRTWQSALDARDAAFKELEDAKSEQDRVLKALQSDIAASESKREKLSARIAQRAHDLESLSAKQQADMTAKQKRTQHIQDRERQNIELQYHIAKMETEAQSFLEKGQEAWRQIATLSGWTAPSGPVYHTYSSPPTPEGAKSALANGSLSPLQAHNLPPGAYGPLPFQPQFDAAPSSSIYPTYANANGAPRGRSSSMLSQYSGFTDDEDFVAHTAEPRHQHTWPMQSNVLPGPMPEEHRPSDGDGSGYGGSLTNGSTNGSNSPRPEAKPFIPASGAATPAKSIGPIGPPGSRRPPPSPTAAIAVGSGR